jgi:hypothetical protein
MKFRLMSLLIVLAIVSTMVLAPFTPAEAQSGLSVPVTGTTDTGAIFTGTFKLTKFSAKQGSLLAQGTLTGTLVDAAGATIGSVKNFKVTIPVTTITGTCDILHLELGPVDLTLLGLVVHLDKIVLDITAQQGGGLLGDLLCAVANLLNTNGPLRQIADLLNQIIDILG